MTQDSEDARVAARLSAETIAALQADRDRIAGELARLRIEVAQHDDRKVLDGIIMNRAAIAEARLAVLLVAASAAYDYFIDKTDADFDGGHFIGNREAGLASELAEAIRKAKGTRP